MWELRSIQKLYTTPRPPLWTNVVHKNRPLQSVFSLPRLCSFFAHIVFGILCTRNRMELELLTDCFSCFLWSWTYLMDSLVFIFSFLLCQHYCFLNFVMNWLFWLVTGWWLEMGVFKKDFVKTVYFPLDGKQYLLFFLFYLSIRLNQFISFFAVELNYLTPNVAINWFLFSISPFFWMRTIVERCCGWRENRDSESISYTKITFGLLQDVRVTLSLYMLLHNYLDATLDISRQDGIISLLCSRAYLYWTEDR